MMNDVHTYQIRVGGHVDEIDINASAPLQISVDEAPGDETRLTIETDQSGLVGVLRYLHGRSFFILAVTLGALLSADFEPAKAELK